MIWFSSDTHHGHHNIITYCQRPFKDVFHQSKSLVARWNTVVLPTDTVFFLGDFAMGNIEKQLKWATSLNGNKFLVPGNHDKVFGNASWYQRYCDAGFVILPRRVDMVIDGVEVILCHFPYKGYDRHGRNKYEDQCPDREDKWLIHGHTHSKVQKLDQMIHIGVDSWNYHPVSWLQVKELMNEDVNSIEITN